MIEVVDIPLNDSKFETKATAVGYFYNIKEVGGNEKRPVVIVCPGGGYKMVSERETTPIATQFMASGYHTVILRYTVGEHTFPSQLVELSKVVLYLREHAVALRVDPNQIMIEGCSAGGHLATSYCELWKDSLIRDYSDISMEQVELLRPNGAILSYPAVLFDDFIYYYIDKDKYSYYIDRMNLDEYVDEDFPRTFVWHTFDDSIARADNSIELVRSLYAKGIPTEFHMYEFGDHGRSIAKDFVRQPSDTRDLGNIDTWVEMACKWIKQKNK
ncbi:MAG: alpha/beta hydrolase [Lachnospiraceae bacterium]